MHHSGAHYIITSTRGWLQVKSTRMDFSLFIPHWLHIHWLTTETHISLAHLNNTRNFAFVSRSAVLVCTLYENLCDVSHTDWSKGHYPVWRNVLPWWKLVLSHVEEFCWCPVWQQGYCSWTCRLICWQGCLSRPSHNWWLYGWSSATVQIRFMFTSSLVQMLFSQSVKYYTVDISHVWRYIVNVLFQI